MTPDRIVEIDVKEWPKLLRIEKKVDFVKVGDWAQSKRGTYKDDVGEVVDISYETSTAMIKMVPQVEFEKQSVKCIKHKQVKLKGEDRPTPRRVYYKSLLDLYGPSQVKVKTDTFTICGLSFSLNGFILVRTPFHSFHVIDPTWDDARPFVDATLESHPNKILKKLTFSRSFNVGDKVLVTSGSMANAKGVVTSIKSTQSLLCSLSVRKSLSRTDLVNVEMQVNEIAIRPEIGDSIEVKVGLHRDRKGMVAFVENSLSVHLLPEDAMDVVSLLLNCKL